MQKNVVLFLGWILYTLVLSLIWYFRLGVPLTVGIAALGSFVGFVLPVFLDVLLPKIMAGDVKINTSTAKDVLQQGASQVRQGNLVPTNAPQTPLRSYPLLAGYFLTAFFVITSTNNFFGRGFVMGLGLSLMMDLFLYRHPLELLKERWFSVFHANLTEPEFDYFVYGAIGVFGILTVLSAIV
ncbi:MAG: hypothetical protein ABI758_02760 [Candidatus Woesebacteria bacterium]